MKSWNSYPKGQLSCSIAMLTNSKIRLIACCGDCNMNPECCFYSVNVTLCVVLMDLGTPLALGTRL